MNQTMTTAMEVTSMMNNIMTTMAANSSVMEPEKDYYSDKVAKILWKYIAPIIIILGTIANILAFLVLCRRNVRHTTTSVFLRGLAIFDTIVLWLGLGREWVLYTFEYEIYDMNWWACTLLGVIVYVFFEMSSHTLALVSVERCATVLFPFKAKAWFTRTVAVILMVIVFIIMCGVNLHFFWSFKIVHYDANYTELEKEEEAILSICTAPAGKWADFYSNVFVWIDLAFYSIIPSVVIVINNTIIIIQLCLLRSRIQDMSMAKRHEKMSSTTLMLLVVTCVFLICTLPARIFLIYYVKNFAHLDPDVRARDRLIWCCLNLLMYINSAINFFLYILTKKKYRRELRNMLSCKQSRTITFSTDGITKESEFNYHDPISNDFQKY